MRTPIVAQLLAAMAPVLGGAAKGGDEAPSFHWDFEKESLAQLISHGDIRLHSPGPRPPEFPSFSADNMAVHLNGSGARFEIDDPGTDSAFDFSNGNAITLEAWVDVSELESGTNRYVIGKGRTHAPGFAKDNQNWALRIREVDGNAHLSFLFATPPRPGEKHWHRWTSISGFYPESGWHHIAATYEFGNPDSITGWIDGVSVSGTWDMGGATDRAPFVDDDAVWIGSSMGGNAGNSFIGMLDEIAVHRRILSDEELSGRFQRDGPPRKIAAPMPPDIGETPSGKVMLLAWEGLESHTRWPREVGSPVITTALPDFYLHRLPFRYDTWGIRDSWKAPALATMAADVTLPQGDHRVLVRTRGLSRLWIDGILVLTTKPHSGSTDGHGPVLPVPEPPAPGLATVRYGDHEYLAEFTIPKTGKVRIILESIIGGKKLRPEPGEMCVAIAVGDTYHLLAPRNDGIEITQSGWQAKRDATESLISSIDAQNRHRAASSQDDFWNHRHAIARDHAAKKSFSQSSIDEFITAKIRRAIDGSGEVDPALAHHVHSEVLPILSSNCFRCHAEKQKGDLRLDSREAALAAITPGRPSESELLHRISHNEEDERMPPKGDRLKAEQVATLRDWIAVGAPWPAPPLRDNLKNAAPTIDDASFMRRAYLDTVGVPPTEDEARAFLSSPAPEKRAQLIDRLLADERFADHWVSYWQDILAENPNMLKPSLNNSGPFRWFLHEALRDNKPLDRVVTELIMLRGSEREGGSAGFGLATDNDSPFAAKAHVIGTAFLGIEMQCARCHDSPYHSTTQRDLYSVAAMLNRKPLVVPESSTVPAGFFDKEKAREPLIEVTLPPGEPVEPKWPFAGESSLSNTDLIDELAHDSDDPRARLAALITAPQNTRFAKVLVNRWWKRLIGAGIVEPAHDWESNSASHPELLDWLATELMRNRYDQKHVLRLIMTSSLYARAAVGDNLAAEPDQRFFAAPDRRRLTAEQVVDSLYGAAGQRMDVEELTFDPDGRRPATTMISLGFPRRAWQFTSLSNERDRPSLAFPKAQAVSDVLKAFGWTPSRQSPVHERDRAPNIIQPGVLANSTLSTWLTRASDGSPLADMAHAAESIDALSDSLFLRFLSRFPSSNEKQAVVAVLSAGFSNRRIPEAQVVPNEPLEPLRRVSWTNHLHPDANSLKLLMEQRAHDGPPPDPRLRPAWREHFEDVVWSLINTPEFVWIP